MATGMIFIQNYFKVVLGNAVRFIINSDISGIDEKIFGGAKFKSTISEFRRSNVKFIFSSSQEIQIRYHYGFEVE